MGRRLFSVIFGGALLALLCWALVVSLVRRENAPLAWVEVDGSLSSDGEDVLFDDDSTVDWSDPTEEVVGSLTDTSVEDLPAEGPKTYEFAVNEDYLNALLEKFSGEVPIHGLQASYGNGTVILSGDASVSDLAELLDLPAALVIFLPERIACRLECVPEVTEGRLTVSVVRVSAGSDIIAPFLSDGNILSSVSEFLNGRLTAYLPKEYRMQSVSVTQRGMYLRFSVE
jgi:hypothetical protein